jgi:signal peptide peptidase SppA
MKYQHIVGYVASQLWAIEPGKLQEILAVLAFRAAGHTFTAEEIHARIGDGGGPSSASSRGAIAIIPVRGMIAHHIGSMSDSSGGTSCERIGAMIDQVATDPTVATILYDFDTPGGTVTGLEALAAKMFALRGVKTQIAMVNGMCASAGYWLASQCDEIVSLPDGQTGSIGVRWTPHEDNSAALAKEGIVVTEIYSGKYKTEGSPNQPMSAETKAFRQAQSDATYDTFVKAVARGRGVTPSAVKNGYGEGRVLVGKDAKAAGLVDRLATMDQTIARLTGRKASAGPMAAAQFEPIPEADQCPACHGAGLKPETYMGDPEGQADCPDCQGTGRKPAAAAMALSGMADVRARRLL